MAEKLTKLNFAMWKVQVGAAIRGARLLGFIFGAAKAPDAEIVVKVADKEERRLNPEFEQWETSDQYVLSYLLSSLSKDILAQVSA